MAPNTGHGVVVLLLLVAAGSATHVMIKYRPYMSVPSLSYKCLISIFGATVLLAYLLTVARPCFRHAWGYRCLVGCTWSIILLGAVFRPAYLSHLNGKVGLAGYPNPIKGVQKIWHR